MSRALLILVCLLTISWTLGKHGAVSETYKEIVDACMKSGSDAKADKCNARIMIGDTQRCADEAWCNGGQQCGMFDKEPGPDCPGFYSLKYLGDLKFRLNLVGKLVDETGFMIMFFSKSSISRPSNDYPAIGCWSTPNNMTSNDPDLSFDLKGINVEDGKSSTHFDRPWLICTAEFTPNATFAYDKEDYFYYRIAGSSNSTDPGNLTWTVTNGENPDKVMQLMMAASSRSSPKSVTPGRGMLTIVFVLGLSLISLIS